ncbi:hypothetical protein HanXRQr2_Chr07g0316021 [Helianthus annuus]|uniref:Uncharacterized protein n=1 Tax=Helianthus annuus TaxID=4232 RepID=A0A9K3IQ44_HELAN|nr:hypothetical protein HanXRQr2_Chr07g0316021 [Helianthus annuus]
MKNSRLYLRSFSLSRCSRNPSPNIRAWKLNSKQPNKGVGDDDGDGCVPDGGFRRLRSKRW